MKHASYRQPFVVSVHDVAPLYAGEIATILQSLNSLVGPRVSLAAVPRFHGQSWSAEDRELIQCIKGNSEEILQHGYTHERDQGCGVISALTRHSDEFAALSGQEALQRMRTGQAILQSAFGAPIAGFIAPSWRLSAGSRHAIWEAGYLFCANYGSIQRADGGGIPLATLSWDWGRISALGIAGEFAGRLRQKINRRAIPCVVIHPLDVRRGFLKRAITFIERLLSQGAQPALFEEIGAMRKEKNEDEIRVRLDVETARSGAG
ncbi:MAG: DUF2334 domain-containing protein [Candidatus Sumerlaeota bacterium]|nr:DUF2334 domain-containing protein [Candidatus Sumerlaeota bacterium]